MKKFSAEETQVLERKIAEMTIGGWTERKMSDELGVSRSWVHSHKKSASAAEVEAQASDYIDLSDGSTTSDNITSVPKKHVILTPKQKKYVEERKQRAVLYNDTAEGWMTTLSEAACKAAGSPLWFIAVVYPESAPEGWKDRLDETGIAWACSPLHDKDKWTHDSPEGLGMKDGKSYYFAKGEVYKTGDPKKAHWHILGKLDKPMKYKKLCALIQDITHGTLPQECESLCGYFDYMTHLHNPDKYPYYKEDHNEIHNGFAPEMNKAERKKAQVLMVSVIHEKHITTWGRLMKEYGNNEEFLDIIIKQSGFFQRCVDHEYYKEHKEARLQYARKQTDKTNAQLGRIGNQLMELKEFVIDGLISSGGNDDGREDEDN